VLLQPSQRLNRRPIRILPNNINITLRIDIARWPPKLNARDDEPHQPQDEEDEGAQDHDPGQQRALRYQPEHEREVDDRERRDSNPIGEVPIRKKALVCARGACFEKGQADGRQTMALRH
jgi:hypothetical protein